MSRSVHPHASSRPADASGVAVALAVSAHGVFHLDPNPPPDDRLPSAVAMRITAAFRASPAQGLLLLGTALISCALPPSLVFGRELAKLFLSRLSSIPEIEAERARLVVSAPRR